MRRSTADFLAVIRDHRLRVFTTSDFLALTGMSRPAATHALRRMASRRLVLRITRGLWVNGMTEDISPYELVRPLVAPWPAYVSLYSALADCGVVQEIPQVVYAVTSSRARRYRTPLGVFHFHHLPERLLWAYEMKQTRRAVYPIAEPEKAFLDLAYLTLAPRSRLKLPYRRGGRWNLNLERLRQYAARFDSPSLAAFLEKNTEHRRRPT